MTRVLIVDDDPVQARALQRSFAKQRPDLTVVTAPNGEAARRLIEERRIDVVLTDLQMPEMDGFELLAWVQRERDDVPVFAMSAYGDDRTGPRLRELGACEYFAKPLDERAVVAEVMEALNQAVHGLVHNVTLASFLQLLEMERKSCTLMVTCDEKRGTLSLRQGALVGAQAGDLEGEAAAIAIVAWPNPSIRISRSVSPVGVAIQSSLGFIVMEAMRLQDEATRANGTDRSPSAWPVPRRTFQPSSLPHAGQISFESQRPLNGELGLPNGARALALVETATGNVLRGAARDDCPVGELARLAAQLLTQEAETLRLCSDSEAVEELVLSTTTRCDVIRPLGLTEFALLVFAPEETNLVIARLELDHFIALYGGQTTRS